MTELEKAADTYSQFACNRSDFDLTMLVESAFKTGAKWAFQNRDVEKVLCAACKYILDGEELITVGFRHNQPISVGDAFYCCTYSHNMNYFEFIASEVQGFLTTQNRFVDREEAAKVAYSSGQIASPKTELHSEDLY